MPEIMPKQEFLYGKFVRKKKKSSNVLENSPSPTPPVPKKKCNNIRLLESVSSVIFIQRLIFLLSFPIGGKEPLVSNSK